MKANNRPLRLTSRLKGKLGRVQPDGQACQLLRPLRHASSTPTSPWRAGRPHPHRHDRDLPETVSDHNIERLREAAHNGLSNYAGVWSAGTDLREVH
jgi:hypothetical protein